MPALSVGRPILHGPCGGVVLRGRGGDHMGAEVGTRTASVLACHILVLPVFSTSCDLLVVSTRGS